MEKQVMRTNSMKLETLETFTVRLACGFASSMLLLLVLALLIAVGLTVSSNAQESQRKRFRSPAEATNALFQAAQNQDEHALEEILGAGKDVTSSSDEVEDKLEREQFSRKYQEMHRLVREPDGTTVLYIGAENWPFPVPLVSKSGEWYFDSARGKQEILFRRIGENETNAIAVCEQFAVARNKGSAKPASEDPLTQFVQRLLSADAANAGNKESKLFHGYYFRVVAKNSASQASSHSNKGVTLVAYPAEYQSSGVMTFVVTRDGAVYEKDLGSSTTTAAPQIQAPTGSSWHPAA
jgi:Protein of unknown function (DUF2950)